jgi:uncharacterized protein DUF6962
VGQRGVRWLYQLAMQLIASPTEMSTSATDALLAIECAVIIGWLLSTATAGHWRTRLWCWVLGLLAICSCLGALGHGLEMPNGVRAALWKPLYLSLGVLVALFFVGAVGDWQGRAAAQRLLPWGIGVGIAFFALTQFLGGAFIVFIVYEALALVGALALYTFLAVTQRVRGAAVVTLAILLNLAAAGVQGSHVSVHILFPFDHNGVFHFVQMLSTATLGWGLRLGMEPAKTRQFSEPDRAKNRSQPVRQETTRPSVAAGSGR